MVCGSWRHGSGENPEKISVNKVDVQGFTCLRQSEKLTDNYILVK